MARAFAVKHLGRAPARFEESQLNVWQREVAHHMPVEESERWLEAETPRDLDPEQRRAFISAIRPNVVLPKDVARWREVVFGPSAGARRDGAARACAKRVRRSFAPPPRLRAPVVESWTPSSRQ